ncbi:MAG: hypothetical protein HC927_12165, partial [Deltaproteobacteria bacterium]|nr:hypothetical protein [Deltaproteobacteria bacterium]
RCGHEDWFDACLPNCKLNRCGNGVVDPGEECDGGGETDACDIDCTLASCGDGWRNLSAGEKCDDGDDDDDDDCDNACQGGDADPQCYEPYFTLTDFLRTTIYRDADAPKFCDQLGVANQSSDWQGPGWYAPGFYGGAVWWIEPAPLYGCGGTYGAYLAGPHPEYPGGVIDSWMCFGTPDEPCMWNVPVRAVNCWERWLLELPEAPSCDLRYCTYEIQPP